MLGFILQDGGRWLALSMFMVALRRVTEQAPCGKVPMVPVPMVLPWSLCLGPRWQEHAGDPKPQGLLQLSQALAALCLSEGDKSS